MRSNLISIFVFCTLNNILCLTPSPSAWWNTRSFWRLGRNPAFRSGGWRNLIWCQCQKTCMEISSRGILTWCWTPSSSAAGTSSTTCTSGWVSAGRGPAPLGAQSDPWASLLQPWPGNVTQGNKKQHSENADLGVNSPTRVKYWYGLCNREYSTSDPKTSFFWEIGQVIPHSAEVPWVDKISGERSGWNPFCLKGGRSGVFLLSRDWDFCLS